MHGVTYYIQFLHENTKLSNNKCQQNPKLKGSSGKKVWVMLFVIF